MTVPPETPLALVRYQSSSAELSPDGLYRYALKRRFGEERTLMVVGLNPSTADEREDDPTIRRCVGFAKRFGCGRLVMVNLYAYRATDPRVLATVDDPVGPLNDQRLGKLAERTQDSGGLVLAAWGTFPAPRVAERERRVLELIGECYALRLTKRGAPAHPLYVPYGVKPQRYRGSARDTTKGERA